MENFRGRLFQEISHLNIIFKSIQSDPILKVFLHFFFWSKSTMAHGRQLILLKEGHGKFSREIISRNFPPEHYIQINSIRSNFKSFSSFFFLVKIHHGSWAPTNFVEWRPWKIFEGDYLKKIFHGLHSTKLVGAHDPWWILTKKKWRKTLKNWSDRIDLNLKFVQVGNILK